MPGGKRVEDTDGWDAKVESCLRRIRREANVYLILGLTLYGGGSGLIIYLLRNQPLLVTLVVMYFFQILVIVFGTRIIFPCIAGAFRVGLLANRESMPAFEKLSEVASGGESSPIVRELRQVSLDFRSAADRIQSEISRLREALMRPIVPRVKALPVEGTDGEVGSKGGNGSEAVSSTDSSSFVRRSGS